MRLPVTLAALSAIALLAACEARIGREDEAAAEANGATAAASAEGQAEPGQFSIDAPGFELKFNIPEGITENTEVDSDSDLLYPGARVTGLHIQAAEGSGRDSVELRFASNEAPPAIADWYREPARKETLTVASVARQGGEIVVQGTEADGGEPFTVRLGPGEGGGTDGRLVLSDRD